MPEQDTPVSCAECFKELPASNCCLVCAIPLLMQAAPLHSHLQQDDLLAYLPAYSSSLGRLSRFFRPHCVYDEDMQALPRQNVCRMPQHNSPRQLCSTDDSASTLWSPAARAYHLRRFPWCWARSWCPARGLFNGLPHLEHF